MKDKWTLVESGFTEIEPPGPGCAHGCHDLKPTESACNWWELEVDEGRATVVCATCHCIYDPLSWDGAEWLYSQEPIPVDVVFEHCAQSYHGLNACDCGWSVVISPRKKG